MRDLEKHPLHIACIIGTRPEVIKMAPVIQQLKQQPHVKVTIVATTQHRKLQDEMLTLFNIKPDIDLNIMKVNQHLAGLTALLTERLDGLAKSQSFDAWMVQGDTTTAMVASLIAFYHHIPFAHVEAGLRSFDMQQPFPEELNRKLIGQMATWHFAPTATEKAYLLAEGIPAERITVTGNPVIDALYQRLKVLNCDKEKSYQDKKMLLVTAHRRENHGKAIQNICEALDQLTQQFSNLAIIYPVHPNPHIHDVVYKLLQHNSHITLLPPLDYDTFICYLQQADIILTDSGGVQEEAPALGKPVLILRDKTERPAIIEVGVGKLIGTDPKAIVEAVSQLLTNEMLYQQMVSGGSPYGDGYAAERIVAVIYHDLMKLLN